MSVSLSQTTSRFKVFDLIDNHSKASSGNRLGNPAANNSKLEKQMDTVESRIDNIEKKLKDIELGGLKGSNMSPDLVIYQKQVLTKLKHIRETLVSEIGNVAEIKESQEVAVAENLQLKKEVERLKYRIQILVKSLEEEENKNKSNA